MIQPNLQVGTILRHSIGCGCDSFYQVVSRTYKTCKVRGIDYKITKSYPKYQSCDIKPILNAFDDKKPITLRLKENQIGPTVRMIWWNIYDPKQRHNQYSP